MERHFDESRNNLNNDLLRMSALTELAIHKCVEALKARDKAMAKAIIEDDKQIDEFENKIEEEAMECLALFQPMAKDLRFITTGMRINTELERIADLTVNICQRVIDIADYPLLKPLKDIPRLGQVARAMVEDAIDSFVNSDEKLAQKVILSDREANELRTAIIQEIINDYLIKDGTTAPRGIPLILVARDLERICDHATFIAEDVIYMVKAQVVKHHRERLETK